MFGKRRRRVNLGVVTAMVAVLVMAGIPAASAHHPEITATSSCRDGSPYIDYTSASWTDAEDEAGRYNSGIVIWVDPEIEDLIGASAVQVGSGSYLPGSPDTYEDPDFLASLYSGPGFDPTAEPGFGDTQTPGGQFSGTVDASAWAGQTVQVLAEATRRWWSVADAGNVELTTVTVPENCPPPPGTIVVEKITEGGIGTFAFDTDGLGEPFTLATTVAGEPAATTFSGLEPGVYGVAEDTAKLPAGWRLRGVACVSDMQEAEAAAAIDPAEITLRGGETVTCTFTNTFASVPPPPPTPGGRIVVVKETLPDGADQAFTFTASWSTAGFTLADGQSSSSGELSAGTYSVAEQLPAGWTQQSASCSDGSPVGAIALAAGETVTCTFVNSRTEVAGIQVTPTTTPAPAVAAVTAETLPFTGFDSGPAALAGMASVLIGAVLLSVTRRPEGGATD